MPFFSKGNTYNQYEKRPFVMFDGVKYSLRSGKMYGYWRSTTDPRTYLHVDVWIKFNGPVPKDMEVHHIDENKNNPGPDGMTASNLKLMNKEEHARKHWPTRSKQMKPSTTGESNESIND